MNHQHTEILFLLDRSGSMESIAQAAIDGFNRFLAEQAAEPGLARLTLVLFDDQYESPVVSTPLAEVLPLDDHGFVPRGMTALLDAIVRGIDDLGQRLAAMPADQRPATVIVAILTDGMENASHHHNIHDVQQRIRHQSEVYNWQFFFLGANQDAIASAAALGIHGNNASNYVGDSHGQHASSASISRKTKALRKLYSLQTLNPQEQADLHTPLGEIVREEDHKRRSMDGH
jgi:hypothetical protein